MRTLSPLAWLMSLLLAAVPAGRASANDGPTGQQIYQQRCASCHGASGEGTKDHYHKPLAGDKSAAQLSRLIAESMPKDDPGTCKGPDADKAAAYIYDAFYSKSARIALSRLTVRQHQNAIADLIAGFRPHPNPPPPAGGGQGGGTTSAGCTANTSVPASSTRTSASSTGRIRRSVLTSRMAVPTRRSNRKSSPSAGKAPSSRWRPAITNSSSAARTASGSGSTTRTSR